MVIEVTTHYIIDKENLQSLIDGYIEDSHYREIEVETWLLDNIDEYCIDDEKLLSGDTDLFQDILEKSFELEKKIEEITKM